LPFGGIDQEDFKKNLERKGQTRPGKYLRGGEGEK